MTIATPSRSRTNDCYILLVTESSHFHPDPEDPDCSVPLSKQTSIESVLYGRQLANILAKKYFIRQHCESMSDSNEDEFGQPTPRAAKWGIWVPEETTKCAIREIDGLCRIDVDRTEFLVEVVKEEVVDAEGPLAEDP